MTSGSAVRRLTEVTSAPGRPVTSDGITRCGASGAPPMSDPCSCILCVAERGLDQAEKDRDAAENRYESALDARLADAALAERAAIVAWLRAKAERAFLGERDPQDSLVGDFATWIEHGDHLRGDDE